MKIKSLIVIIILFAFVSSCEKVDPEKTWVSIGETQCANPWDNIGLGSTKSNITEYLKNYEVIVYDFKAEVISYGPFCKACTCSSGRIISVLVQNTDLETLKSLGFRY